MAKIVIFLLSAFLSLSLAHESHWKYLGSHGPDEWEKDFEQCGGEKQSPVDVNPYFSRVASFEPFYFTHYHTLPKQATVTNNGHSLEVKLDTDYKPQIAGGNLGDEYVFAQFHIHWGADDLRGSEHTVNHVRYPMEMHMVHYKKEYGSVHDSLDHDDGLAVLSVLFVISKNDNPALAPVISQLNMTKEAGNNVVNKDLYPLTALLPKDLSRFYRYKGSLTTPPCSEVVIWTIFEDYVSVSEKQIKYLRNLVDSDGAPLVNNFRKTQPLNGRKIYRSFKK